MRQWLTELRALADRIIGVLFGYDIFISYSRSDAVRYPPELANRLRALEPAEKFSRLSIYVDQWGAPPGDKLPARLVRALKRSGMLIIVVSRGAAGSSFVRQEVDAFVAMKRLIIPIIASDVDLETSWPELARLHTVTVVEDADAIHNAEPSERVIRRVAPSAEFITQAQRLRRSVQAAVGGIAVLLVTALLISTVTIQDANETATKQTGIADGLASSARADVLRAESLQSNDWAQQIQESTLLAIDAAQKLTANGHPPGPSYESLRRSLDILPRSMHDFASAHPIEKAFLSADGRYLIAEEKDARLRIYDSTDHKLIAERNRDDVIAYDADRTLAAIASKSGLSVLEIPSLRPRWTQAATASSLTLSPDGTRLAALGHSDVTVFDVSNGTRVRSIHARLSSAAISPDNTRLALSVSGKNGTALQMWDLTNQAGRPIEESVVVPAEPGYSPKNAGFSMLTFNTDGKLVIGSTTFHAIVVTATGLRVFTRLGGPDRDPTQAVGNNVEEISAIYADSDPRRVGIAGDDGTLHTFDLGGGQNLWSDGSHPGSWHDGRRFATLDVEGGAEIVDISTGRTVARVLTDHADLHADYALKGERLVLYNDDHVWLYDLRNSQQAASIEHHETGFVGGTSGKYAVVLARNEVIAWDVVNLRQIARLGHASEVEQAKVSAQGNYVATITDTDRTLHLWDTASSRELWHVREDSIMAKDEDEGEDTSNVVDITFSPKGNCIVLRTGDGEQAGTYLIRKTGSGEPIASDLGVDGTVTFSPDDHFILLQEEKEVRLIDVRSGIVVARLPGTEGGRELIFSPDSRQVAGVHQGDFIVWSTANGRELFRVKSSGKYLQHGYNPNGKFLIVIDDRDRRTATIVNTATGVRTALVTLALRVSELSFSQTSRYVAIAGSAERKTSKDEYRSEATVLEIATGRMVAHLNVGTIIGRIVFTPDDKRIVLTEYPEPRAHVVNLGSGVTEGTMVMPKDIVNIALSGDAHLIAISGKSVAGKTIVRLWETATRREMATLNVNGNIETMRFVGGGTQFATFSNDLSARRWILDGNALMKRACGQLLHDDGFKRTCAPLLRSD